MGRIDHNYQEGSTYERSPDDSPARMILHYGDLCDAVQMVKLLYELQPEEIYNLWCIVACGGVVRHS